MKLFTLSLIYVTMPLIFGQSALAQQNDVIYAPVDQVVDDIDVLSSPMRRLDAGLRMDGEHTSMFEMMNANGDPLDPINQYRYLRVAPGFRVRTNRMEYLVLANPNPGRRLKESDLAFNVSPAVDGAFIELMPAGLVYDLRPLNLNIQSRRNPIERAHADDLSIEFQQTLQMDYRIRRGPVMPIDYEIMQNDAHDLAAQKNRDQGNAAALTGKRDPSPDNIDDGYNWVNVDPNLDLNPDEVPLLRAMREVRESRRRTAPRGEK